MTRRLAISAVFTALSIVTSVPARAQSISEGQSCGGLLCDMGVFGHKSAPPASPPPPAAPAAAAPPPKAAEAATPEPVEAEPKKRITRKKKRLTKAAPVTDSAPAPVAATPPPPKAGTQSAPSILNPYAMPQTTTYQFKPIYQ